MKTDLPQKAAETLNSLNGLQPAKAAPFLYSKIRTRLQSVNEGVPQRLMWRLVGALVIAALVNVLTLLRGEGEQRTDNGARAVASEYAIALPQTY